MNRCVFLVFAANWLRLQFSVFGFFGFQFDLIKVYGWLNWIVSAMFMVTLRFACRFRAPSMELFRELFPSFPSTISYFISSSSLCDEIWSSKSLYAIRGLLTFISVELHTYVYVWTYILDLVRRFYMLNTHLKIISD